MIPQGFELVEDDDLPAGFEVVEDGGISGKAKALGKKASDFHFGALEMGVEMLSGTIPQIAGGLAGTGEVISGMTERALGRDTERARSPGEAGFRRMQQVQDAIPAYRPQTEGGQAMSESFQGLMEQGIGAAGDVGERLAGNEGRFAGEVIAGSIAEFIPLGGIGGGVAAGARRGRPRPEAEPAPASSIEDIIRGEEPAPVAEALTPPVTPEQGSLFDQGQLQTAPQYGIGDPNAMWGVDETGMPFRPDLSIEAQSLQNPLQRDIFGETELGPALGQERSLTAAIDQMGWAQRRGATNRMMRDVGPSPDLQAAMLEAEGVNIGQRTPAEAGVARILSEGQQARANQMRRIPRSQRGAININEIVDGLSELYRRGVRGLPNMTPDGWMMLGGDRVRADMHMENFGIDRSAKSLVVELFNENNQRVGQTIFEFNKDGVLQAKMVRVGPGNRNKGYAASMYAIARASGYDIRPDTIQTADGQNLVKSLQDKGIINKDREGKAFDAGDMDLVPKEGDPASGIPPSTPPKFSGKYVPKSQLGGVDKQLVDRLSESFTGARGAVTTPNRADTPNTPRSPEMIKQKQELRKKAQALSKGNRGLKAVEEWTDVNTVEEAKFLAGEAKDIPPDFGQRQLGSGINFQATMSNNPVLRFARKVLQDARRNAEAFSSQFITDNKNGINAAWNKLTKDERVAVLDALKAGDKYQKQLTPDMMDKLGFNDAQRQYVDIFYRADQELLNRINAKRLQLGLSPIDKRSGHFPGIFNGAYKSIVEIPKRDSGGNIVRDAQGNIMYEVGGVIAVDSSRQARAAQEWFKTRYPDAKFGRVTRTSLEGNHIRSDAFSGQRDIINELAKNDPRFAEIQQTLSEAIIQGNKGLFSFDNHELAKKGVIGNQGNKPWLKPYENAMEAHEALVRYFEEGALYAELQVPLHDLRELSNAPEVQHMPNVLKYLDDYTRHITGESINTLGNALNWAIDRPFEVLGMSPKSAVRVAGGLKNRMSQLFMGWFNIPFLAVQLSQPGQTAFPFFTLVASRLGLDNASAAASFMDGGQNFMRLQLEDLLNDYAKTKVDTKVNAEMREAYQYAKDRGLLQFSEIERAYEGTKTRAGQAIDRTAEFTMMLGEKLTRTPVFMGFYSLLRKGGIDQQNAMRVAEHLTQQSMVDYSAWERPQLYAKLGITGQFAGGLATFKHGYASMQPILAKEIAKTGNATPILTSIAAMITLAGASGLMFYDEMDQLYGMVTEMMGERKSLRETVLSNAPTWVDKGIVSTVSGIHIQGKYSSANMIGDSVAETLSPHLTAAWDIGVALVDLAKKRDERALGDLLYAASPASLKGVVENKYFRHPETGALINKEGQVDVFRTPQEWTMRSITGLRSTEEVLGKDMLWEARLKQMSNTEAKRSISEKILRESRLGILTNEQFREYAKKYQERGGDVNTLVNTLRKDFATRNQTTLERARGTPNTISGVHNYRAYQHIPNTRSKSEDE